MLLAELLNEKKENTKGMYTDEQLEHMKKYIFNEEKNPIVEIVRIKPGQEITIEDLL